MIPLAAAPEGPWWDRFRRAVTHPVTWLRELAGGGPVEALLVLFALNAVDELHRSAFGVLAPDIADHFGVGIVGITVTFVLAFSAALGLTVWIANLADRYNRVRLALLGGVLFAVFAGLVGAAPTVWLLGIFMAFSQIGKAIIDPTHNSLLADYFPVSVRPRVFSFHRAANTLGQFIGPVAAGFIAHMWGWRAPFLLFTIPTLLAVLVGSRLKEPVRGAQERRSAGATGAAVETEEEPPSFAEAWRMCMKIDSLRRIYRTLPLLAPAFVGYAFFAAFLYRDVFGLDERARGVVAAVTEPFGFVGLLVGARIGMRLFARDPRLVFRFLGKIVFLTTAMSALFALSPNIVVAVAANIVIATSLAFVAPGIFSALSIAIPPRARAMGFSMGSVFVLAGLALGGPLIALIAQAYDIRTGMLLMCPLFLVGGLAISSAGDLISSDIENVWKTSAARAEQLAARRRGESKILVVRGLQVSYGDVQVLFDVDLEVGEGEIIALLGTNGAGKSTLLKAVSGVVEASKGAVIFDGRDITHAPPHEIAAMGVVQIPGGQGVFPSLTVWENLRVAGWLRRRDESFVQRGMEEVWEHFPVLRERADEPAANLSGGQQQMLALGMAFLQEPKLLMIDELSLGLAPVVTRQLLPIVRRIRDRGAAVIVVEQSVNTALTLAETAYFMEKGEIRFHGPTRQLLQRPDILRSVFLEGAEAGLRAAQSAASGTSEQAVGSVGGGDSRAGASAVPGEKAASGGAAASGERAVSGASAVSGEGAVGRGLRERPVLAGGEGAQVSALELRAVARSFGGIRAVDDVSFRVEPGEILGIIGPNGAGKTTLFDIISGLTPADSGRVLLGGVDVTDLAPHERAILGLGRSFQDARLFPSLTVEETIKVALDRWIGVRDPVSAALHLPSVADSEQQVQQRVDELIELLGLEAFRAKFVRELSTGSRRIVDLACVVAHGPSVVLLDEPSSGIAQKETEALAPLLLRIREQLGASLVVIEHDMPLISSVSDRMLALDQGRVVTCGSPQDVLSHPDVVASYLGGVEELAGGRTA
ncbi:MAG: hypothetical protein KatS3mg008_1988 [Acidimicrobiales bacterium]|nr:MAG: hypothetical protein KatS3mg008_1988 [Acidimicrobiales bacterium]